jgi:hypothetical protein
LGQLLDLLDECAALPVPEQAPGETFVEQLQASLRVARTLAGKARDWGSRSRDALAAGDAALLEKLAEEARTALPVGVPEAKAVSAAVAAIKGWRARAAACLPGPTLAAATPATPAAASASSSRSSSPPPPPPPKKVAMRVVAALLEEASATVFLSRCQPEHRLLKALVLDAKALSERLGRELGLGGGNGGGGGGGGNGPRKMSWARLTELELEVGSVGVVMKETSALEKLSKRVHAWKAEAEGAMAHSPDLKHLSHLIDLGDALPVAFPLELGALRAKLAQAEAWVERVRSAVPQKATRKNAVVEKADFGDMKNLLHESADIQVRKAHTRAKWHVLGSPARAHHSHAWLPNRPASHTHPLPLPSPPSHTRRPSFSAPFRWRCASWSTWPTSWRRPRTGSGACARPWPAERRPP